MLRLPRCGECLVLLCITAALTMKANELDLEMLQTIGAVRVYEYALLRECVHRCRNILVTFPRIVQMSCSSDGAKGFFITLAYTVGFRIYLPYDM